jgi:site-specific recombinase XerD
MPEPLYLSTPKGKKIRLLSPKDYDKLVAVITKLHLRTLFEVCFWSGMRYIEVQRLWEHPEWWLRERNAIHLPREATKKPMRQFKERYIPIPNQLAAALPYFFENPRPPVPQVWWEDLNLWAEKAGLGTEGISPKITRATIESWMYAAGLEAGWICNRQGHTELTSLNHYRGIAWTDEEKEKIKRRLAGWG